MNKILRGGSKNTIHYKKWPKQFITKSGRMPDFYKVENLPVGMSPTYDHDVILTSKGALHMYVDKPKPKTEIITLSAPEYIGKLVLRQDVPVIPKVKRVPQFIYKSKPWTFTETIGDTYYNPKAIAGLTIV